MHHKETISGLDYLKVNNNSAQAIFMIHGYGASMHDLFGLTTYLDPENRFDWYFPNGHLSINLGHHMEGRAWFPVDMEKLQLAMMRGEFRHFQDVVPPGFDQGLECMSKFVASINQNYDSIIVGGFSQGAMLASHLAARLSNVKAAVLFSGVLTASSQLEKELKQRNQGAQFFQSHGKQDPVLNFSEAAALFEMLKLYRWQGHFNPFDGGHEIPLPVINKAQQFLSQF